MAIQIQQDAPSTSGTNVCIWAFLRLKKLVLRVKSWPKIKGY